MQCSFPMRSQIFAISNSNINKFTIFNFFIQIIKKKGSVMKTMDLLRFMLTPVSHTSRGIVPTMI